MPGIIDYLLSRQGPQQTQLGAGPTPPPAPASNVATPLEKGQAIGNAFSQYGQAQQQQQAFDAQQAEKQSAIAAQDAALAEQEEQIGFAREQIFQGVAAGSLPEQALQQFDVAPDEAKLALAQQAFAPPEQLDPEAAAKLEIEQAKLGLSQQELLQQAQQFGLTQEQQAQQFAQEQGFSRDELAQEAALAEQTAAIRQQAATPDILQLVEAAGLEPTPENIQAMAQAQADRTIEAPKAPSGYQFNDASDASSGLKPIPGGPADPLNPKNFTGEQRKVAGFHGRAAKAQSEILELEAQGFNPSSAGEAIRDIGGRVTMSQDGKRYRDNQDEFVRVILRKDTGAAVTADERQEYSRYFPEYGDGPEDIARKAEIRQQVLSGLKDEAGAALAPSGGGFDRKTSNGVGYRILQ